jgi:hypothetical protein
MTFLSKRFGAKRTAEGFLVLVCCFDVMFQMGFQDKFS